MLTANNASSTDAGVTGPGFIRTPDTVSVVLPRISSLLFNVSNTTLACHILRMDWLYQSDEPCIAPLLELPTACQAHHVERIIPRFHRLQLRHVVAIHLLQWGAEDGVVRIQRRISDLLATVLRNCTELRSTLLDGVEHGLICRLAVPSEVHVRRLEGRCAIRWIGGIGAVGEDTRKEGLNGVREECARRDVGFLTQGQKVICRRI